MIIVIGNEKGGVGKTMLVSNLAVAMTKHGHDVVVIDGYRNAQLSKWGDFRNEEENISPIPVFERLGNLSEELLTLNNKYEHVLVKVGGRDSTELRSAFTVANKVFVPVTPGQFDYWSLGKMDYLLGKVKKFNPEISGFIIANRITTHPKIDDWQMLKKGSEDFEHLKMAKTHVFDRITYKRSYAFGKGVLELIGSETDAKASLEIEKFYEEVVSGIKK